MSFSIFIVMRKRKRSILFLFLVFLFNAYTIILHLFKSSRLYEKKKGEKQLTHKEEESWKDLKNNSDDLYHNEKVG